MTRAWMILAFAIGLGAVPASGHHAFGAYYIEDQTISIEGTLVELEYLNPHSWIHIAAADTGGNIHRVSGEWSNAGRLMQQGITKETLRYGDRLIMTGSPARIPSEYKMHLKRIERRADGWSWIGRAQKF